MPTMQLPNPSMTEPKYLIRHSPTLLPRDWSTHPLGGSLVCTGDVAVSRGSTLRAKVLVFKDTESMRTFWTGALGRPPLSKDVAAVVNDLSTRVEFYHTRGEPRRPPERQVDPRYFAVMGFNLDSISMENITHESVHAALAYLRRARYTKRWPDGDCFEEHICYPAGRIAAGIHELFHSHDVYKKATEHLRSRDASVPRRRTTRPRRGAANS